MDEKKLLEEQLREAACIGDTDAVQELINLGVDVNAKNSMNGWTPLHWACKRNYLDVVVLLLKSGADKNIKSDKDETPASVSVNPYILQLLGTPPDFTTKSQETPSFVPNYLRNPISCSKVGFTPDYVHHASEQEIDKIHENFTPVLHQEELVLKIRIANSNDPDFIEVDLPCNALTYQNLIKLCCNELEINESQIFRLRKLPNTKIRRNKDVQRLQNHQEIEVIIHTSINDATTETVPKTVQYANGSAIPVNPTNNYQSISKKDQTILY